MILIQLPCKNSITFFSHTYLILILRNTRCYLTNSQLRTEQLCNILNKFGNKKGKPTAESWNLCMCTIDSCLWTEVFWAN